MGRRERVDHAPFVFPSPGDSSDTAFGQAKGVIALSNDGSRGFWLTHSIPGYPSLTRQSLDQFYSGAKSKGHSMMCVTLTGDTINTLALSLQLNKPKVCTNSHSHTPSSPACETLALGNTGPRTSSLQH